MEFREADQVRFKNLNDFSCNIIIDYIKYIVQTEKAYQKQDAIFIGRKRVLGQKSKKVIFRFKFAIDLSYLNYFSIQGMRFYKNVGLGFKTPKAAIDGSYVDKKCPFTGNVSIRGRILKGMVISNKMKRTVVIRRDYLQYIRKFRRYD